MSTRSDVGIACKPNIQKLIDALFPWVRVEADDVFEHKEGTLYHFIDIKWYPKDGGDVERRIKHLKEHFLKKNNICLVNY